MECLEEVIQDKKESNIKQTADVQARFNEIMQKGNKTEKQAAMILVQRVPRAILSMKLESEKK